MKLLINRPSLGFEDVEDVVEPEAAQILELTSEQAKEGKPIQLRFVRFQSVNSLHVRLMFVISLLRISEQEGSCSCSPIMVEKTNPGSTCWIFLECQSSE